MCILDDVVVLIGAPDQKTLSDQLSLLKSNIFGKNGTELSSLLQENVHTAESEEIVIHN